MHAQFEALFQEALELQRQIETRKARLAEINKIFSANAVFGIGKKTVTMEMDGGGLIKVVQPMEIVYDLLRVHNLRVRIGDKDFGTMFTMKYVPLDGKAKIERFVASHPELRDFTSGLYVEKPKGSRRVTYVVPGGTDSPEDSESEE